MPAHQTTEQPLAPELEAIAAAAADQLRAQTDSNTQGEQDMRRTVAQAASAAIAAGLPLGAIADAERAGHTRARHQLGTDVLREVERAAGASGKSTASTSMRSSARLGSAFPIARSRPQPKSRTEPSARSLPALTRPRAT